MNCTLHTLHTALRAYISIPCSRLPVPTLVTYNKTSYNSDDDVLHETDIGPEVTHIYQVETSLETVGDKL